MKYGPTSAQQIGRYVAVYSFGGHIDFILMGDDFKILAHQMRAYMEKEGFDRETDDARVFTITAEGKSTKVFSYHTDEEMIMDRELEVYNTEEERIDLINRASFTSDMVIFYDPLKEEADV